MEEDTNSIPINEAGEDAQTSSKGFFWTKPKKMLVVLICAIIALIIYLLVISSYIRNESKEKKSDGPDNNPQPGPGPGPGPNTESGLGSIYCVYNIFVRKFYRFIVSNTNYMLSYFIYIIFV